MVNLSEAAVQAEARRRYDAAGWRMFRNNSGVLLNPAGRPVRFGLGNESAELNAVWKSSDLIGWRPTLVTPDMVGSCVAVFVAREAKPNGWHLTPGDKRGHAQKRFIDMLLVDGGDGAFETGDW